MKDSRVYREVAEEYAEGKHLLPKSQRLEPRDYGVCDMLGHPYLAGSRFSWELREEFRDYFARGENGHDLYYVMSNVLPHRECRRVRVLALLFLAAIVESEGR